MACRAGRTGNSHATGAHPSHASQLLDGGGDLRQRQPSKTHETLWRVAHIVTNPVIVALEDGLDHIALGIDLLYAPFLWYRFG